MPFFDADGALPTYPKTPTPRCGRAGRQRMLICTFERACSTALPSKTPLHTWQKSGKKKKEKRDIFATNLLQWLKRLGSGGRSTGPLLNRRDPPSATAAAQENSSILKRGVLQNLGYPMVKFRYRWGYSFPGLSGN